MTTGALVAWPCFAFLLFVIVMCALDDDGGPFA